MVVFIARPGRKHTGTGRSWRELAGPRPPGRNLGGNRRELLGTRVGTRSGMRGNWWDFDRDLAGTSGNRGRSRAGIGAGAGGKEQDRSEQAGNGGN